LHVYHLQLLPDEEASPHFYHPKCCFLQDKKKSKKNKKDKKDKKDKDGRHSKHADKDKDKHGSRKDSVDHSDEEGQVVVGGGKDKKDKDKDKGAGGSPATKRPRVEGGEKGHAGGGSGDVSPEKAGNGEAHKVEENGDGSAPVPL